MTAPRLSDDAERLLAILQAYAGPGAPPLPPDGVLAHLTGRPLPAITAARRELEAAGLVPAGRAAA